MDIVLAGGSGFIGQRLIPVLRAAGHDVRALSRHPDRDSADDVPGWGSLRHVQGDVADGDSLSEPFADADVLIYLVHSLGEDDFERRDAEAAWATALAAKEAGISRIVYLGGLGEENLTELSAHLRSRREVEGLLGAGGIPVTVLRAGIIVGHGSISWEITRQLVANLPVLLAPQWVSTRSQPIAVDDVVAYLAGVVDSPETAGVTYEIGGPDVLTYREMLRQAAKVMGHHPRPLLTVPFLTPRLSGKGLRFVTDVDPDVAASLVESMGNEVIVRDDAITRLLPRALLSFSEAARLALAERDAEEKAEQKAEQKADQDADERDPDPEPQPT